jgi:hypothetical protein
MQARWLTAPETLDLSQLIPEPVPRQKEAVSVIEVLRLSSTRIFLTIKVRLLSNG